MSWQPMINQQNLCSKRPHKKKNSFKTLSAVKCTDSFAEQNQRDLSIIEHQCIFEYNKYKPTKQRQSSTD